jgi:hypothetical protein
MDYSWFNVFYFFLSARWREDSLKAKRGSADSPLFLAGAGRRKVNTLFVCFFIQQADNE